MKLPKNLQNLKVALVTDWLTNLGGGEKVVEAVAALFPKAPIYTTVTNFEAVKSAFPDPNRVKPSYLQKIPILNKRHQLLLPLLSSGIESHDLSDYDLILSFSSCIAKNAGRKRKGKHICYIHTPVRYGWEMDYDPRVKNLPIGLRSVAKFFLKRLKNHDYKLRKNPDLYIANSSETASRVEKFYHLPSKVLYPPVDIKNLAFSHKKEDYYLGFGRMVIYKKFDLLVDTFLKLPNKKLILAGVGPQTEELQERVKKAGAKNITFAGRVSDEEKCRLFAKAKAFILPQKEDAGIVQLEAMASGTPVIAYRAGGVLDVLEEENNGIFFEAQTVESLTDGIKKFESKWTEFDAQKIKESAEKFSTENFQRNYLHLLSKELLNE